MPRNWKTNLHVLQGSIVVMLIGAVIAGATDLTYSLPGYIWVSICAISTAMYLLLIRALKDSTGELPYALCCCHSLSLQTAMHYMLSDLLVFWPATTSICINRCTAESVQHSTSMAAKLVSLHVPGHAAVSHHAYPCTADRFARQVCNHSLTLEFASCRAF